MHRLANASEHGRRHVKLLRERGAQRVRESAFSLELGAAAGARLQVLVHGSIRRGVKFAVLVVGQKSAAIGAAHNKMYLASEALRNPLITRNAADRRFVLPVVWRAATLTRLLLCRPVLWHIIWKTLAGAPVRAGEG